MLQWLTPAERRGASVLVLILLIGAGRDWWVARGMRQVTAVMPYATPTSDDLVAPEPARGAATAQRKLDLNRADAKDLDALPGIGPVLAARILSFRQQQGRFDRVEDLLAVRGVGPRLFDRLRPLLTVTRRAGPGEAMHSAPSTPGGRADSGSVARLPSR